MSLVSCIIPTYKRPEMLSGAVNSVLTQTHENVEVILVYELADEETASVVTELAAGDPRIEGVAADAGSPMAARNVGIEAAEGEYVAFLDDDDRWQPQRLEAQLPHAAEYSVVSCLQRIVRPNGSMILPHDFTGMLELDLEAVFEAMQYFPESETIGIKYLFPSGTIAKMAHVQAVDGFDERLHEWDFYIRMVAEHGPAAVLDQPLVEFNREDIERYCERAETIPRLRATMETHRHRVPPAVRRRRRAHIQFATFRSAPGELSGLLALVQALSSSPREALKLVQRLVG